MKKWFSGKKTYLLAGAVYLVTLVLVFTGRLTPQTACAVALVALAGFATTFRAALQAHQDDVVKVLQDVAAIGQAAASGNIPGVLGTLLPAVEDAASLVTECREGENA